MDRKALETRRFLFGRLFAHYAGAPAEAIKITKLAASEQPGVAIELGSRASLAR